MESLDKLPLPLLIAMGLGLAVIFGVRYLGLMAGEKNTPSHSSNYAQVATVIVDPAALIRLTEQAVKLNQILEELCDVARDKIRVDSLMATELDRMREELRIQREIARRP